ncbi:hypothetical protein DH2020_045051 [Rehmannia glutinosa]|uniref:Dynamin-related protein 3A-like n=1 Tax=Rehmannia glutinosa TaxID=99300 RepID=A0ABR0UGC4_REHGL
MAEEQPSSSSSSSSSANTTAAAALGHSVIPLVNKLQDIFAQLGSQSTIELPQVAVVGSQSSGKSSVLEALVGRDFLPRGNDICTRRPLVLQLVQRKRKADGTDEEWGEFLHLPGKKFFDFNDIRKEIQELPEVQVTLATIRVETLTMHRACHSMVAAVARRVGVHLSCNYVYLRDIVSVCFAFDFANSYLKAETEREAGGNKGVSDKQIRLKIFSPNVLDITLVDLPGLTKVPVGDQPSDIEARIRTMIMSYIKRPSCLILAVTPANSDLANSDALQMAGIADPDGVLMLAIFAGKSYPSSAWLYANRNHGIVSRIVMQFTYCSYHGGKIMRWRYSIESSIKDALIAEEKFFRSRPVYNDLAERCGVPQLAKKLNQILVQHIKTVLPGLKTRISAALVSVAKEHASYGEITESKAGQGALLLNILSKYSEVNTACRFYDVEIGEGKHIEKGEVDPCEDLTDDDIRTAIQNATGPKSALFVPEVPFEVLIRRQIARLLDPSLQCARFIYDELIKMSHRCMINEMQRFPVLRKRMDEVIGNFLREGLEPSETMIGHIIEMEMDYINTSHPNFIGGSKAVEIALQQTKSSRIATIPRQKEAGDSDKAPNSERSLKSRAILARQVNGIVPEQGVRPVADVEKTAPPVSNAGSSWGISSIFGSHDNRTYVKENSTSKPFSDPVQSMEQGFSMIHLREVNHTKRELHNVFIKKLYRDNLFEEMLQEPDEVAMKRKRTRETLRVLQQAFRTLDELPLEAESVERGYSLSTDPTGLPKIHGLPTSSLYNTSSGSTESYSASPKNTRSRKSSHSGELHSPYYGDSMAVDVVLCPFIQQLIFRFLKNASDQVLSWAHYYMTLYTYS